ncbi:MAG: DUF1957 domain-containing protein [Armatimonadetes bacterium]|nr:DUF1957 domain-containing protein [Armatimonadota bacterium]
MAEPLGYFALVLHSHIPYVMSHGKWPHGTDWLTESAVETYLPLIDTARRLESEGIAANYTINLTPILQEQLASEAFKAEFVDYLRQNIDASRADQKAFGQDGPLWMAGIAYFWEQFYAQQMEFYINGLDRDILGEFRRMQDAGLIEVITSAATHGYLALLGTDESVFAQTRIGAETYRRNFGRSARGFWLPECSYRPAYEWSPPVPGIQPTMRQGVEMALADSQIDYFFVDTHLLRGGEPTGTYAARFPGLMKLYEQFRKNFQDQPDRHPYQPYLMFGSGETHRPVAVFARDPETTAQVWSGDMGYPGDAAYLEFHKKHAPSRLRYWRVSDNKADLGAKEAYEPWRAYQQIRSHADHFVTVLKDTLRKHRDRHGRPGILVSMYDTELFGHWWFEGPEWVYEAIKRIANDPEIEMVSCGAYLDRFPPKERVVLPEGSWGEGGYHYVWLNKDTAWVWERIYRAEAQFLDLKEKCANNEAAQPYLQQLARELLLLQSSDWPFLITTWSARDYAEIRINDHFRRFEGIASLIDKVLMNERPTEAELALFAESRERDPVFDPIDLNAWSS